ncbi:serine/threonine protein kinase [Candidatus Bathyarchaeota archaeon]|nr:serine/threonine protein kinase [Candidatus Bathyarchaeota archaeon]NIU81624.1 serine/threonine protein kinase [Candidatus Bathyarchaeota archaeon]NIV68269.1 serine/threonine protein kinase [Candidatus Bathyarchaeota archaeon]NIW16610.1 serine/threonine protein kinase [Candidatus Bathyarchaeota archaeon]NIW34810.1 serine/threonine protein kinase [Candidatus Bathyarchaeota archaeon]
MSAADIAVENILKLEPEDFQILEAIEKQAQKYQFLPPDIISNLTDIHIQTIQHHLRKMNKRKLLTYQSTPYEGYKLTTAAHDLLALKTLVARDIIEKFGKPLGVGKESDVYEALTPEGNQVAVKIHRLGRTSFHHVDKKRGYTTKYRYTPDWHKRSTVAAKKEYLALKLLEPHDIAAPKPLARDRHILVMSKIEGAELYRYLEIPTPETVLQDLLKNVRLAYQKANIIHADLSPYNILLQPDMQILIIDWPQYVKTDHPNAQNLLTRDLENILQFFKHPQKPTLEEAITYVTT